MSDKKILNIPHVSQILDISSKEWHLSACGIASLAMVLEYYLGKEQTPSVNELLEEGLFLGGFSKEVGWTHSSLVLLAHNHNLHSYHQEFRSHSINLNNKKANVSDFEKRLVEEGIDKLKNEILNNNPVIVSVKPLFGKNKGSHIIVLTGVEIEKGVLKGFYYNDSLCEVRGEGEGEFVNLEKFLDFWKKFAIFISKKA